MPTGTRYTVTGELCWDARIGMYRLELGDGAYWFVDVSGRTRHFVGKQVTVEGARSGFNLLDVDRIWLGDGPPPPRSSLTARLRRMWPSFAARIGGCPR